MLCAALAGMSLSCPCIPAEIPTECFKNILVLIELQYEIPQIDLKRISVMV